MNYKIALYCKTYPGDFDRVVKLVESIKKYNRDDIPLYISTEAKFHSLLVSKIGKEGYTYIADQELYEPSRMISGWEHQMLVKLNAFTGIPADNLLLLDSDAYFITDFYEQDFIAYDNIPYTIIHENTQVSEYEALLKGGDYSKTGYVKAVEAYRSIFQGKSNRVYDYGPNPHLWSRKVIEHFNTHYLAKNNLSLDEFCFGIKDQFDIHFRETLTYGEYLLATKVIDIVPCGPLFKVYHWKELYDFEMKLDWVKEEEIKKTYLGIIKQSNWS